MYNSNERFVPRPRQVSDVVFRALSLTLLQHDVQQQSNAYDYGPFAIALTLCLGLDPSICSYNEKGLRGGIRQIFTSEELIPLQSGRKRAGLPRTRNCRNLLHLSCGLPGGWHCKHGRL